MAAAIGWTTTPFALSGQPVSGLPGRTLAYFNGGPILNFNNTVAFSGGMTTDTPYPVSGIFVANKSGVSAVLRGDEPLSQFGGALYDPRSHPVFNGNGTVVFRAQSPDDTPVLMMKKATEPLSIVAKLGDPVPGVAGATFNDFMFPGSNFGLSLNFSDDFAFLANYLDGGFEHTGAFLKPHDGPLRTVLADLMKVSSPIDGFICQGDAELSSIFRILVNNSLDVAVELAVCTADRQRFNGIYVQPRGGPLTHMPGTFSSIDRAPDSIGGTISSADVGVRGFRSSNGRPFWVATLQIDGGNASQAVITQTLDSPPVVRAKSGMPAPDTQGTFSSFITAQLSGSGGKVAFVADIDGDPQVLRALYMSDSDGSLSTVALQIDFNYFYGPRESMSINRQGHIAFLHVTEGILLARNPKAP